MIQLLYTYDKANGGATVGDIFSIAQSLKWTKRRNAVSTISFSISMRKLRSWCKQYNFDVTRFFTPIKSSVVLISDDGEAVIGGYLSETPEFSFTTDPDATASFSFVDGLGLATGFILKPVQSFTNALSDQLVSGVNQAITASTAAGAPWPISVGSHIDTLDAVTNTVSSPKKLSDFLTERTDNTTGAGPFDVYFDAYGVFEIWDPLGTNVSSTTILTWPDTGAKGGCKSISFPAWSNYYSNIFMSGSGNGYGDDGGTIISRKVNNDTIANTGYYEEAVQDSSISDQTTLDSSATSYLRYTSKPFSNPTITIDGDNYKFYDHRLGGTLWVGDTVALDVSSGLASILPIDTTSLFRVDTIAGTVDRQGKASITLTFVDPTTTEANIS